MYNSLNGTVTGRGPNRLFLSTGGIEWDLEVSGTTLRELAGTEETRVFTHLYHREDQMRLYGFASADERRVFLELIRVSGIGPRAAIRLLSSTTPANLVRLLEGEDVDGLVSLPGLGKKTAQKIILALRGKLVAGGSDQSSAHAEIIDGLVEMGFDRSQVVSVIQKIVIEMGDAPKEDEIFHQAIVRLSGEG